jgi:tRNA G18 (ribose-2'-O)-methylase SpoU
MPHVFLYAPQDFHNLCLLTRTLEVFGQRQCYVFDPARLIRERYGRYRTRELRAVSAGAFEKIEWLHVEDPPRFFAEHGPRVVATVASETARPLAAHHFSGNEVLLFGSESQGLPDEIVASAGASVTIPQRGETQSLNLAVALGIVLFEWDRQVRPSSR